MVGGGILPRGPELPNTPRGLRTHIPEKVPDEYQFSDYVKSSTPQRVPASSIESSSIAYLNQALVNCRPAFPCTKPHTPRSNASEFRLNPTGMQLSLSRERCPPLRCPEAQTFATSSLCGSFRAPASASVAAVATQVRSPRFEPHRLWLASDQRLVTVYVSPAHEALCGKLPTFDHVKASGYGPSPRRQHHLKPPSSAASVTESLMEIGQFEERLAALQSERRAARQSVE
jgi:hypothetical protein